MAESDPEYAAPTEPLGRLEHAATSATQIVMLQETVAVCPAESLTWAVNGYVPAVVGVPLKAPAELRLRPGIDPLVSDHV